jgi:hypothetical protein
MGGKDYKRRIKGDAQNSVSQLDNPAVTATIRARSSTQIYEVSGVISLNVTSTLSQSSAISIQILRDGIPIGPLFTQSLSFLSAGTLASIIPYAYADIPGCGTHVYTIAVTSSVLTFSVLFANIAVIPIST